jgi:hypothetical protein
MRVAGRVQDDSSVHTTDLAPYLGRRCQLMVQCAACGRTHVHEGTLGAAARPGELQIAGWTYEVTQVRALVLAPSDGDADTTAIPRAPFNLALVAGLGLALLTALRIFAM